MAVRIIWSPLAVEDLERIVEFIARDSPSYAAQVASDVIEVVENVTLFPRGGSVVPEVNDPLVREV